MITSEAAHILARDQPLNSVAARAEGDRTVLQDSSPLGTEKLHGGSSTILSEPAAWLEPEEGASCCNTSIVFFHSACGEWPLLVKGRLNRNSKRERRGGVEGCEHYTLMDALGQGG